LFVVEPDSALSDNICLTSQILDTQIPTNMLEDKWPTPVKIQVLQDYLLHSNYDSQEIEYLVDGFSNVTREIIP
jgi:hypothetical protein